MRIFLLLILASTCFLSCKKNSSNLRNEGDTENVNKIELLDNAIDENLFVSDLRANESLHQNIIYIDTVKFITFDTPGDYNRITVSKNSKKCYLLNSIENNTLSKGDTIIIKWEVVENHSIEDPTSIWFESSLIELIKL